MPLSLYGIKLNNGSTILAHILQVNKELKAYEIAEPIELLVGHDEDGHLEIKTVPWAEWSDIHIHYIPTREILMVNKLSNEYVRLYGSMLFSIYQMRMKKDLMENLTGNHLDYWSLYDLVEKLKITAEEFSEKYDVDLTPAFEGIEEKLLSMKPQTH
jgi:hypothetical protein